MSTISVILAVAAVWAVAAFLATAAWVLVTHPHSQEREQRDAVAAYWRNRTTKQRSRA